MIQSVTLPRPTTASTDIGAARRADASSKFTQSLSAFLDSADAAAAPADPVAGKNDQIPADTGNPLPNPLPDDHDDPAADPALAWLTTLAQPPITPPPPPPVAGGAGVALTPPPVATLPTVGVTIPVEMVAAIGAAPTTDPVIDPAGAPDTVPTDAAATDAGAANESEPLRDKADAAIPLARADMPPASTPTTMPAAEAFGAAMRAASGKDDDQGLRRRTDDATTPITAAALEPQRHAVAATTDAQQTPLDMNQARWPHMMIDRIEQLRDSANANDTRIRLVPDALGTIDISMRREGDMLHVHFAAEQAATRTLLNDAQPQLATLAQARGMTLGQAGVDAGTGGNPQNAPTPQPRVPIAPPTGQAFTSQAPGVSAAADDIRIA